jgi:hypothetical protein
MPVTFDNIAFGATNGQALKMTLTAATAATMIVFVVNDNGRSVSSIAYNGVALTKQGTGVLNGPVAEMWILSAPNSGVLTLSLQMAVGSSSLRAGAVTYTNVKAANGFGTSVNASAFSTTNVNMSLSSTTTDIVVGMFMVNNLGTLTMSGNIRGSFTCSATSTFIIGDTSGAAPITLSSVAGTSGNWCQFGIPLIFSAATVTSPYTLSLLGCGL